MESDSFKPIDELEVNGYILKPEIAPTFGDDRGYFTAINFESGMKRAYLIKNHKAKVTTAKSKAAAQKLAAESAVAATKYASDIEDAIEKFGDNKLTIKSKTSDKGHLFEGLGALKIAKALSKETGIEIPESALVLKQPIKEIGEHTVGIVVNSWEGALTVLVEAE